MTLSRLHQSWVRLPGNARGALWMLVAGLAFSAMAACMKVLTATMPVWQMLVLRSAFAIVVIAPALVHAGAASLVPRRPLIYVIRSVLGMGGVVSFFLALSHLEIALVTALSFSRALFIILLAVIFLDERIRWRRWLATGIGFLGVIICVRPGTVGFDEWTLVALAGAMLTAGVSVSIKRLTATEAPLTIVLWTYVLMGLLALPAALLAWRTPGAESLAIVALMSLLSAAGQSCMVHGLRAGEATAVAPFEYARLLYAAGFGYVLFAEVPASSTWAGAVVIIGSTIYIALREARLGSRGDAGPA